MSALLAQSSKMAVGARTGRPQRAVCVRPVCVAVPSRKVPSGRPAVRTAEKATLVANPVTESAVESVDAVEAPMNVVHVLSAEKYHDFLAEHADKLITMDFYAVWCGPCKMIAPELDRMASQSDPSKLIFAKMDCGATNESKKLAMSLGIKALPTFHLYRNNRMVDSMTGAKVKALQDLISKHL